MKTTALVLLGGGARGAYQAGVLARLGELMPDFAPGIITGVSVGAINAMSLANHGGSFEAAGAELAALWSELRTADVISTNSLGLGRNLLRWASQLAGGGRTRASERRALLDTAPLRGLLARHLGTGDDELAELQRKLHDGRLQAVALTVTSYRSGKSLVLADTGPRPFKPWIRPYREGHRDRLGIDHVMASAAIPLVFPAARVKGEWCGDGSVRQIAPLSPALHLGADRLLLVPTSSPPQEPPAGVGDAYPAPARVAGVVLNALMFDSTEYDTTYARRITELVNAHEKDATPFRPAEVLVVRPSVDLGALAAQYERVLPLTLRYLYRGLGTGTAGASDLLATLLFEGAYTQKLIAIGRADVDAQWENIQNFLRPR